MYVFVDFDGVLADTTIIKKQWVASATGRQIETSFDRSTLLSQIGETIYSAMQSEVGFEDTLLAPPVEGAVMAIRRLSAVATIVVVSARPPEKMVWLHRWLELYGLKEVVGGVVSAYGCAKSDVVLQYGAGWLIDDDVRHAAGLPNNASFVLFGGSKEEAREGVLYANDWTCIETMVLAGL